MNNRIAVITDGQSDILKVLEINKVKMVVFRPGEIFLDSLEEFKAILILGGTKEEPLMLQARERILVEAEIRAGKKVFSEYCGSIAGVYYENPSSTRFHRLVLSSEDAEIKGIEFGDILDDQCGTRIRPHKGFCNPATPLLQYVRVHAHKKYNPVQEDLKEEEDRALWFEKENLLICGFRLSQFNNGRFSPIKKIRALVEYILTWVIGDEIEVKEMKAAYYIKGREAFEGLSDKDLMESLKASLDDSLRWINNTRILIDKGRGGVYEGFGTEVYPDGGQRFAELIRADCAGELSLLYFLHHLYSGSRESLEIADNLNAFIFDYMQVKEEGPYKGMIRWTQQAFETCYQDDVARAINGYLLRCIYTGDKDYLPECLETLEFLISTTGTDGTRVMRTDVRDLSSEKILELQETPGNLPSAHYNAYYHGSLLLAYKLTGNNEYLEMAVKGLTSIMEKYPETVREQSQTEEYCRLILPLSWLYWITKEDKHKKWLYKVAEELQEFRHSSGAYLEWDEGYKATMRNTKGDGECSLLAENGDSVVDLLYSNNWLPLGFMQAYLVTGDDYFKELWEDNIKFILGIQINSDDNKLSGAWARGFDVEYMEYFGSPADAGWGPWAMESGWTIGEIAAGIALGLLKDKLKEFYI